MTIHNVRYRSLRAILLEAEQQASGGKGADRHDPNGELFEDQQIVQFSLWMRSNHGNIFQACKKATESTGLPHAMARNELLGAINYLAAGIIVLDMLNKDK